MLINVYTLKEPGSGSKEYYYVSANYYPVRTEQLEEDGAFHRTFRTSDIEVFLDLLTDKGLHWMVKEIIAEHL